MSLRDPSVAGPDYKESCARNRLYRRDLMVGAQLHTCADVHNWTHVQMCTVEELHMCEVKLVQCRSVTKAPIKSQSVPSNPACARHSQRRCQRKHFFQATQPGGFCIFVRVRIIFCSCFHHQPIENFQQFWSWLRCNTCVPINALKTFEVGKKTYHLEPTN